MRLQVLAGQDPVEASRYQIMITYLIAGGAFTSVGVAVVLASRTLFDSHGCFRSDMLVPPQSSRKSSTATTSSKTSDAGFSVASDKHFSDGTLSQVTLHQQKTNKVSKSDGGRVPHENAAVVLAGRNLQGRVRGRLLFELATFSVVEGEICVVRGVSGRGKTRLLALLNATCPFNEHDCRDATTGTLSVPIVLPCVHRSVFPCVNVRIVLCAALVHGGLVVNDIEDATVPHE